ncbi:MAG: hypothetical protein VX949_10805 [Planctomycetota bacterium]|nr:hypothetical protein [Planctomycetota bacterium]
MARFLLIELTSREPMLDSHQSKSSHESIDPTTDTLDMQRMCLPLSRRLAQLDIHIRSGTAV